MLPTKLVTWRTGHWDRRSPLAIIAGTARKPVRYLLVASRLSPSFQRVSATTRHGFYSLETDWTRTPPRVRSLRIAASRAKVAAPVSGCRRSARRFEGAFSRQLWL